MNSLMRGVAAFALVGWAGSAAWAAPEAVLDARPALLMAQNLPNSGNNNPYNSPTRRANPKSMQGTQPSAPAIRGPNTAPTQRPPTLENGGIGNGYPRSTSPARTVPAPSSPAPRDSNANDRR